MADFKAVQRILSKFPVFKALSNTLNQDNIDQILPDLDSDSYVESALFYIALILLVISCLVVLSKSGFFLIKLKIRTPAGGNYIELPDRVVVDDARRSSLTQSNPVCAFKVWRKQPAGQDKEPIFGYISLRNSVCQHLNYCVLCYCDCPGLSSYQDLHFKKIRQRSLDWAELCKIGKKWWILFYCLHSSTLSLEATTILFKRFCKLYLLQKEFYLNEVISTTPSWQLWWNPCYSTFQDLFFFSFWFRSYWSRYLEEWELLKDGFLPHLCKSERH